MESTVKRKQLKYEPLTQETDIISADLAMYQAAHVLDLASIEAMKQKDVGALLTIAELWIGLAKSMEINFEEEERSDKVPLGFAASAQTLIERREDQDGEETN